MVINIFIVELTIQYPTKEIMKTGIIQIKSCKKKINSSIKGELASCKFNWPQVIIKVIFYSGEKTPILGRN